MRVEARQNLILERKTMPGGFVRKRCPKCGGNVYLDRDQYDWYEKCLQCTYTSDLNIIEIEGRRNVRSGSLGQTGGSAQAKK